MNSFSDMPSISNVQLYQVRANEKVEDFYENNENHNETFFSQVITYLHNPNECSKNWIWDDHECMVDPATPPKIKDVSASLNFNDDFSIQSLIEEEATSSSDLDVDFFQIEDEISADLATETNNEMLELDASPLVDIESSQKGFDIEGFYGSESVDNSVVEEKVSANFSGGVNNEGSESNVIQSENAENSFVENDDSEFLKFEENSFDEEEIVSAEWIVDVGMDVNEHEVSQIKDEEIDSVEVDSQEFLTVEENPTGVLNVSLPVEDQAPVEMEERGEREREEVLDNEVESTSEGVEILFENDREIVDVACPEEIDVNIERALEDEIAISNEMLVQNDEKEMEELEEDEDDDFEVPDSEDEILIKNIDDLTDYEVVNEPEGDDGEEDFSNSDSGSDSQDSSPKKHSWEYFGEDEEVQIVTTNHLMGRVWEKMENQKHHFRIFEFPVM